MKGRTKLRPFKQDRNHSNALPARPETSIQGVQVETWADAMAGMLDAYLHIDGVIALSEVAEAYAAMDERRATKVLLQP